MNAKNPSELRGAIGALLPLVDDAGLLARIMTQLASAAAGMPAAPNGPRRKTPVGPNPKRQRILAGTILMPEEHFAQVLNLRDRFGPAECARRLKLPHQSVNGFIKSQGRCFPLTAEAVAKALATIPAADLEPVAVPAAPAPLIAEVPLPVSGPLHGIAMEVAARASADGCSAHDILRRAGIFDLSAADDTQMTALRELLDN